jgi:hypothetical protein
MQQNSGNVVNPSDAMEAMGKGKAGHSNETFNIHQFLFLVAVGFVAFAVSVASGVLKLSNFLPTPAIEQTESRTPSLQLTVNGSNLASQVGF